MKESLDASKMMTTLYMSYFCRLHKLLIILYLHNNTAMWVKQIQIQTNKTYNVWNAHGIVVCDDNVYMYYVKDN